MTEQNKRDRIFLQVCDDEESDRCGEVMWYPDRNHPTDVEYIRKELYDKQLATKDEEIAEDSHLRERMSKLLALTAIALKGPNDELSLHSWHDLPEKADELKQQLAAKDALLLRAQTIMRHAWRTWYFPRGWEPLNDEQREFDATLAAIDKELGK